MMIMSRKNKIREEIRLLTQMRDELILNIHYIAFQNYLSLFL